MKVSSPYKVRVVVDPSFGERLSEFPAGEPVWVVDSGLNAPVAMCIREQRVGENSLTGITTFRSGPDSSPEDTLLGILDRIELHHGEYSADPAYSILEIFGCAVSDRIRNALAEYGFTPESSSSESVRAVRTSNI